MKTSDMARQLGTYSAIAQMMRDAIRKLDAANDDWTIEWERKHLTALAEQLDEAEEKMKKEVDNCWI